VRGAGRGGTAAPVNTSPPNRSAAPPKQGQTLRRAIAASGAEAPTDYNGLLGCDCDTGPAQLRENIAGAPPNGYLCWRNVDVGQTPCPLQVCRARERRLGNTAGNLHPRRSFAAAPSRRRRPSKTAALPRWKRPDRGCYLARQLLGSTPRTESARATVSLQHGGSGDGGASHGPRRAGGLGRGARSSWPRACSTAVFANANEQSTGTDGWAEDTFFGALRIPGSAEAAAARDVRGRGHARGGRTASWGGISAVALISSQSPEGELNKLPGAAGSFRAVRAPSPIRVGSSVDDSGCKTRTAGGGGLRGLPHSAESACP